MAPTSNKQKLRDDFVFRERVAEMDRLHRLGFIYEEIGLRFGICEKTVERLLKLWKEVG